MEYIDKTILEDEGEAIIQSFLERLKMEGAAYPEDMYNAFRRDKKEGELKSSKEKLIEVLLLEQDFYCCYCMQQFGLDEKDEVTLEHLILNSITEQEGFDKYLLDDTILKDKVCLASDFIEKQETNSPPYPHTVAYQNLTASCNGKVLSRLGSSTHCNLKRGDKYMELLPLYPTIKVDIEYNKDTGFACWTKETKVLPTLNMLGLNSDLLKLIRKIWFYSIEKERNILEIDKEQKKEFLRSFEEVSTDKEFEMLSNFINTDAYWNLLKRYKYFGKSPNVK